MSEMRRTEAEIGARLTVESGVDRPTDRLPQVMNWNDGAGSVEIKQWNGMDSRTATLARLEHKIVGVGIRREELESE